MALPFMYLNIYTCFNEKLHEIHWTLRACLGFCDVHHVHSMEEEEGKGNVRNEGN